MLKGSKQNIYCNSILEPPRRGDLMWLTTDIFINTKTQRSDITQSTPKNFGEHREIIIQTVKHHRRTFKSLDIQVIRPIIGLWEIIPSKTIKSMKLQFRKEHLQERNSELGITCIWIIVWHQFRSWSSIGFRAAAESVLDFQRLQNLIRQQDFISPSLIPGWRRDPLPQTKDSKCP